MDTARLLRYAWPFYNIIHESVNQFSQRSDSHISIAHLSIERRSWYLFFLAQENYFREELFTQSKINENSLKQNILFYHRLYVITVTIVFNILLN